MNKFFVYMVLIFFGIDGTNLLEGNIAHNQLGGGSITSDVIEEISRGMHQSAHTSVRVAIDFGSGTVKMQVSVVDEETNRLVNQPLLTKYTPLTLVEDVAIHHGLISPEMQQKALEILKDFKEEAMMAAFKVGYSSIQFAGIATAIFRKALNGQELLLKIKDQLGISFEIVSQDEEGLLGFLTAQALYPEIAPPNLIAWDSGSGSFQLTTLAVSDDLAASDYLVYQGPLGQGTVRVLLSRDVRQGPILLPDASGNPINRDELNRLIEHINALLPRTPDWLREKLLSKDVVVATFGSGESIFLLTVRASAVLKEETNSFQDVVLLIDDVEQVVDYYIDKHDEDFNSHEINLKSLTAAIQLLTVMKHFGINAIHYRPAIGSTAGMLIAPHLWKNTQD